MTQIELKVYLTRDTHVNNSIYIDLIKIFRDRFLYRTELPHEDIDDTVVMEWHFGFSNLEDYFEFSEKLLLVFKPKES